MLPVPQQQLMPPSMATTRRPSKEIKFLPPLPPNKTDIFINPRQSKNEVHVGSLVQKLKEDRIVQVINRQMEILQDLKYKISNQAEVEQKKLSDYVEKLEKDREDFLRQQKYEEMIKERVEKKIRDYLSYGMGYNPYYPSLLPYLIFNLPKPEKKREEEDGEDKKKKKKGKKRKTDKKKTKIVEDKTPKAD